MIEQAPDGWFIAHDGRYYHLNQTWLAEMGRHQVKTGRKNEGKYNTLVWTFNTSDNPQAVFAAWKAFYFSQGGYQAPGRPDPTPFQEFIKGQRANRR
jgi:hypothetical protein